MRNLLWKDFWQNSRVLLAVAIVAAGPYVVLSAIAVGEILVHKSSGLVTPEYTWVDMLADAIADASFMSLYLSVLLAAFVGGNAIAGERADRSAEFAACMPISRGKSVASKAIVAAEACLVMWAVNAAILAIAWQVVHPDRFIWSGPPNEASLMMMFSLIGIVLLFGLAWLYSSLLSSPAISAAAALGTAVVLVVTVQTICSFLPNRPMNDAFLGICIFFLAPAIGVLSFAAGAKICLKRAGP